jgi:nitroreductase
MQVEDAIRERRTLKEFTDAPVAAELVGELLELAVLAPNHHETEPWRFWVVGPKTLQAMSDATGDKKLLRSQTAIVVGVKRAADAQTAEEDYAAVACSIQNIMLAARGRGLASFWRTPGVFSRPQVARILEVPKKVRLIGMVHLGIPGEPFPPQPERSASQFTHWLD